MRKRLNEKEILKQLDALKSLVEAKSDFESPRLFITDYQSYNEGTQFECGKWWDLSKFKDADKFEANVIKHLQKCTGNKDLELMVTDSENIPDAMYSETMDFNDVFTWINLDDDAKVGVEYLMSDLGYNLDGAMEVVENGGIEIFEEYDNWEYFVIEENEPDVYEVMNDNGYLVFNSEIFMMEKDYNLFKFNGKRFIVRVNG